MKFTITGSLGNISKPLTQILVAAGHQVTVISSKAARSADIEALGAIPAIGSIEDVAFLTKAFTGADAVYTMVPPDFGVPDYRAYYDAIGENYVAAIKAAGVNKVVNLSSIGADKQDGTGPIKGLHDLENKLNAVEGIIVKHLRAGFFFVNWLANTGMVRDMGILGSNYSADTRLIMVHPADIADAVAAALSSPFTTNEVSYVSSDIRTAGEVATVLGTAIGKPELPWVAFTDEQALGGMLAAGMPLEISNNYVEMGAAANSGLLFEHYKANPPATMGVRKLEDFASEFAAVYNR